MFNEKAKLLGNQGLNTNSQESKISRHINGEVMDLWFILKSTANTQMKINSNQSNKR